MPAWQETTATVTDCRYDIGAGRAMAFGLPTSKRFVIRFEYRAAGELHTGEFRSSSALPPGTLLPVRYNPDLPHEHDRGTALPSGSRVTWLMVVVTVLTLTWLLILRGCRL